MSEAVDYYANHRLKLRFPWRLYHRPIVEGLARVLREGPGGPALNVGSGPFLELRELPEAGWRWSVCDIDPRAVEAARGLHGEALEDARTLEVGAPLPYPDGAFALVTSMDVIEHVPEPAPWLAELVRVLRPGGRIYLTTPNYGRTSTLPLIEATVLELIARSQGFSRRELHPSRFDCRRLTEVMECAGLSAVEVHARSLGWVLSGTARKPQTKADAPDA
ncbi:MAG: class I SAM-dependent methyltransferase [Deltaproteobacteria bacterium]|nr:class I SAM-dependent methyltransferase [Deltaproteobacteria bacterium]